MKPYWLPVLIGTIATGTVSGSSITLSAVPSTTVTSIIYAAQPREAIYTSSLLNIACTMTRDGLLKMYLK